jgi:hypothetical protein
MCHAEELIRISSVKSSQRKAVLQAQKSIKNRLNETGSIIQVATSPLSLFQSHKSRQRH